MPFPQPYFHDLVVHASWDGVLSHAVDLDISFSVNAIPNSRLRLISKGIVTEADITRVNGSLPDPLKVRDPEECSSTIEQNQSSGSPTTEASAVPTETVLIHRPAHVSYESRIPLSTKSNSLSPRKRRVPIALRPPWNSPLLEDVTKKDPGRVDDEITNRRVSRSADGNNSPTKNASFSNRGRDGSTKRGRQILKADGVRGGPGRASSEIGHAEATSADKVKLWLDKNTQLPEDSTATSNNSNFEPQKSAKFLWGHTHGIDPEPLPNLPPSPSPSSQAAVPWTSVKYRNPLQLRGGESSAVSLDILNGFLYAAFPGHVVDIPHLVHLRASIHLREDDDKGGHLLEIPGLPTQVDSHGLFVLQVVAIEAEEEYQIYEKIAYVNSNLGETNCLTSPRLEVPFDTADPFCIKLLRFQEGTRVLQASEFEIDYDTRALFDWANPGDSTDDTICVNYLTVCTLRLHQFLFFADSVRFTVYMTGGPSGILHFELGPGRRRIRLTKDQCGAGHELEITLTMKVQDVPKNFSFLYETVLGAAPFEGWTPRISAISRDDSGDVDEEVENAVAGGVLVTPKDCGASRSASFIKCKRPTREFSMLAQEKWLASKKPLIWYPENQLTPGSMAARYHEEEQKIPTSKIGTEHEDNHSCLAKADEVCPSNQEFKIDSQEHLMAQKGETVWIKASLWTVVKWILCVCLLSHYVMATGIGSKTIHSIGRNAQEGLQTFGAEFVPRTDDLIVWEHVLTKIKESTWGVSALHPKDETVHKEKIVDPTPLPEIEEELTLRDRVDRALGWKGPHGDW